jgi:hypothetical protein
MRGTSLALSIIMGTTALFGHEAFAAEGATSVYLLGSKQDMAGTLPPPGVYVVDTNYVYSGRTNVNLDVAGLTLSGGVKADAYYKIPTLLWVTPGQVLGGNFALSITTPIGWKDVSAGATLTGPGGGTLSAGLHDTDAAFGDPLVGASFGWHEGTLHYSMNALYNAPLGFWKVGNASNIGFNRSALDFTPAFTWLDPRIGLELSAAAGVTFNFENPDTNYKTGNEFHLEWAAKQHFSQTFSLGLVGYHYSQFTGDSGSGARLGDFKGRVTALGPSMNYTFNLGQIPVTTNLKYMREFDVKNRLEGDVGFLTFIIPVSVGAPPAAGPTSLK